MKNMKLGKYVVIGTIIVLIVSCVILMYFVQSGAIEIPNPHGAIELGKLTF